MKKQALHAQSIVWEAQDSREECLWRRQLSRFPLEQCRLERRRRLGRRQQCLQRAQLVGAQAVPAASSAAENLEELRLVRLAA